MRIRGGVRGGGPAVVLLLALCVPGRATSPPDLTGRWVTMQRTVAIAQLPFLGEVSILTTIGLDSEITQSGSQLVLRDRSRAPMGGATLRG